MYSPDTLKDIIEICLNSAHQKYLELGVAAIEPAGINQFGDASTQGDIRAEDAVINVVKQNNLPIRIVSEEHKIVDLENQIPRFTGMLDGIDGSGNMKSNIGIGEYGTMFSIYEGLDPRYTDWLVAGIMLHSPKPLMIVACRGQELEVMAGGQRKSLTRERVTNLTEETKYIADQHWPETREITSRFPTFGWIDLKSSAAHYVTVLKDSNSLLLECTRKGNLELATGFPLLQSLGGDVLSLDGQSIGPRKYFDFGQNEHLNFVASVNPELAQGFIRLLSSS